MVEREEMEKIDMKKVEKIVEKMRKKYAKEGIRAYATGEYDQLRGLIIEGRVSPIEIQRIEDLKEHESKTISFLGNLYLTLGAITKPIFHIFSKFPFARKLELDLYSANMRFSAKQWLALSTIVTLLVTIFTFGIMLLIITLTGVSWTIAVGISLLVFFLSAVIMLLIPKQRAEARGKAISYELPFALRHIATQLSAGIGLYRTLQAVAKADYGPLSEEFARTIAEIEEGTDTQDALRHLALRTRSLALRNAIMHTIRALKTGGNLSDVMSDIAEDVAFQLRMNMREFGQKMNFIGVIFIFLAIVFPVFVAILGSIRNAPIGAAQLGFSFRVIPLSVDMMALIYFLLMPALLLWIFIFIKVIQPHV